jgi:hypothetical protein
MMMLAIQSFTDAPSKTQTRKLSASSMSDSFAKALSSQDAVGPLQQTLKENTESNWERAGALVLEHVRVPLQSFNRADRLEALPDFIHSNMRKYVRWTNRSAAGNCGVSFAKGPGINPSRSRDFHVDQGFSAAFVRSVCPA